MGPKEMALFDVALGMSLGEATFEGGIMMVSLGFHKMKAVTIREVMGDVWSDLLVPDGLTCGGSGLAEGCIAEGLDC